MGFMDPAPELAQIIGCQATGALIALYNSSDFLVIYGISFAFQDGTDESGSPQKEVSPTTTENAGTPTSQPAASTPVPLGDNSLVVDISDALSEKDKVKFTVHTRTTIPGYAKQDMYVVRQHEEFVWLHDRFEENEEYAGYIVGYSLNHSIKITNLSLFTDSPMPAAARFRRIPGKATTSGRRRRKHDKGRI